MLIDVVIPGDRNVIKKEAGKILKYTNLIIQIQCMWNVKAKVIPVVIGAAGTISKSLRQYVSNVSGKTKLRDYKTHTGHCTHTVDSTNVKVQNILHSEITLHVAQIVNTE